MWGIEGDSAASFPAFVYCRRVPARVVNLRQFRFLREAAQHQVNSRWQRGLRNSQPLRVSSYADFRRRVRVTVASALGEQ